MKRCRLCGDIKPLSEFYPNRNVCKGKSCYRQKRPHDSYLTDKEERVVALVADGKSDKLIGRALNKNWLTIRDQVDVARKKLGATNRAHLVSLWIKTKI